MTDVMTQVKSQRVAEALFLAGLGVIWGLDIWWPGLLIDFGAAWGVGLTLRGQYWPATAILTLLAVVPAIFVVSPSSSALIPVMFVGLGAAGLFRALVMKRE